MCSGSGAGSYLRLIDYVYHSTLGLRVIKKKTDREEVVGGVERAVEEPLEGNLRTTTSQKCAAVPRRARI